MSEKVVVTDADITKCIKYMIELAPPLKVDDDGFVLVKETGDKVKVDVLGDVKDTKVQKDILVYKGIIPEQNIAILNPFIEGMTKSDTGEWFFDIITSTAGNLVRMVQKSLLIHTLESKKQKDTKKDSKKDAKSEDKKQDLGLIGLVSRWVDKVDDTTITEFEQITKKISNYFTVRYFVTSKEARVVCGIINNDDFRVAHRKVRQKTWDLLIEQLKFLFGTEDFEEFTVKSKIGCCPKLDATARLLLKVYTSLNPYLKYLPESVQEEMNHKSIDLDYISNCIDLFEVFKAKSVHISLTAAPPASAKSVVNPLANAIQNNNPFGFGAFSNIKPVTAQKRVLPLGTQTGGLVQPPSFGFSTTTTTSSFGMIRPPRNPYETDPTGGW